jgi:hypothetical protein
MPNDTITLSQEEIDELAAVLCLAGFNHRYLFQNKLNRDAVAKAAKQQAGNSIRLMKGSTRNQLLDPRYTVEGRHIPDQGLNNDYKHYFAAVYSLDRTY